MSAESMFRYGADPERAKRAWLAQWQHKTCGGTPRAQDGQIKCTGCPTVITWAGPLGITVPGTGAFRSLVED